MSKTLQRLLKSMFALFALICSTAVSAQTTITDEAGLKAIADDLSGSYVLAADITLSGEWAPIGTSTDPFTGTLDGAGHTIKGLTITTYNDNVGLFSFTNGATMKNIKFEGVKIYGWKQAGALAGQAIKSTIDQIFASGTVYGYDHVGGIVGDVRGDANNGDFTTVSNCAATTGVFSVGFQAGVIAGWTNAGEFKNNVALGICTANVRGASGICGLVDGGAAIFTGNVCVSNTIAIGYKENRLGGIYGWANGDCSIDCSNNYTSNATALKNDNGADVDDDTRASDNNGETTEDATLKTVAFYTGLDYDAAKWNLVEGQYPLPAGVTAPIANGDAIYTNQLPEKCVLHTTFNLDFKSAMGKTVTATVADPSIVSVDGTTLSFDGIGSTTVTLATEADALTAGATEVLTITVSDINYALSTPQDVLNMKYNLEGDYTLANDIDMAGVEFTPLNEFTGTLDGKGHYIRNLSYNDAKRDNVGLFTQIRGAAISDIGFEGFNLVGNANVGALAGHVYGGTVNRVYVGTSYLEGRDHVGSIAGDFSNDNGAVSVISNCLANAKIFTRQFQAGGFAGVANGTTVDKCLFCGTVDKQGSTNATALVGLLDSSDKPTLFTNNMAAPAHLNGNGTDRLIGIYNDNHMDFENNYWAAGSLCDGAKSGVNGSADDANAETVTDDDAKSKSFYEETLGFDFTNDWKFVEGTEGKMYPILKWMETPLKSEYFDLPKDLSLLYTDGSECVDLSTIHSSWGQPLTFELIENSNLADYVADENVIYVGDEEGNYVGAGDVKVKVSTDASLASLFTNSGNDTFTFYVDKSGLTIEIATAADFLKMTKNLGGDYKLTADIDMSGVEFPGIAEGANPFTGTLDGQGHYVKNLTYIPENGTTNKGIFGQTNNATIKNIGFVNITVGNSTSRANHAGLIGSANGGTIDQVAVSGTVYGDDHVAMLAGDGDNIKVTNTYITGTVDGRSQVGGFFGCTLKNGATISKCYSNVNASASWRGWVGGFIGLIDKANSTIDIQNCVSIGNCSSYGDGSPHVTAPFIAGNNAGDGPNAVVIFKNNIYNTSATMDAETEWPVKNETMDGGDVEAPASANPTTLQSQNTYTNIDWDFENIWSFDTTNGYLYPVLKVLGGDVLTGVESVKASNADYAVSVAGNVVTVNGLNGNATVKVVTIAGQNVASVKTNSASASVNLPGKGIYVIAVTTDGATESFKIINK